MTYEISSGVVLGRYIFSLIGIYEKIGDGYLDLNEYSGDGDEVSVEIERPSIVKVINQTCARWGDGDIGYDCRWYFAFIDGSHGVCGNVRDLNNALRLHFTTPESEGYWIKIGCYEDDSIRVKGALQSDWLKIEIEWIDDSVLQYQGDGDAVVLTK